LIVARVETTNEPPEPEVAEVVVEKFDDTLPLDPIEPSQFDETVKDTQKLPVPEELKTTDKIRAVRESEIAVAPPKTRSVLRWMLVVMLLLGAAGAWLYWNYQAMANDSRSTTSR
jgi:hypothetical protein